MIGTTLKRILDDKGVNPNELARQIGVSNQTIYGIIKRDNTAVNFGILLKICTALDVDIEVFYRDFISDNPVEPIKPKDEGLDLYNSLDDIDKAEIRGMMKHMLKAEKYKK